MHAAYVVTSRILGTNTSVLALLTDSVCVRCLALGPGEVWVELGWQCSRSNIYVASPTPIRPVGLSPRQRTGSGPGHCDSRLQSHSLSVIRYIKLFDAILSQIIQCTTCTTRYRNTGVCIEKYNHHLSTAARGSKLTHVQSAGASGRASQECISQGYESLQVFCTADHGLPGEQGACHSQRGSEPSARLPKVHHPTRLEGINCANQVGNR